MTVDAHPFPVLEQSGEVRSFSVKTLIFDELKRGRVRFPDFQRRLRWGAKENVLLFDSLMRGYPIGGLILWKRPAEAGKIRIGQGDLLVPSAPDARWVVDGQQRLTALAAAMLDIADQAGEYLVHFDPHAAEFFVPIRPAERRIDEIPLTILADAAKLNKWIRARDLSDAILEIVDKTRQRILDYSIPVYDIESHDEVTVRAVFMRINTTGLPMRANEVFDALLGQTSLAREEIRLDVLVEEVRAADFGELERGEALKCILGASGLNPTDRPENLDSEQLRKLIPTEEAQEAIRRAVMFLKDYAQVPHIRLLPYPVVLIILTRFFHVHSQVEVADLIRLSRWVWLGAITGLHQRAEVSRMREALRHIREADTPTTNIDRLLEGLTLLDQEPRRLPLLPGESDGGLATVHELLEGERLAPEIHRLPSLKEESTRKRGKTAANRILLNGRFSGLGSLLEKLDPERHAALLQSHVLDARMLTALREGNPDLFLQLRGDALMKLVIAFLTKRAGIGEPIMAPMSAYLD
jgi:hypothetical protein